MPAKIVNLTSHEVHLHRGDHMITIEPSEIEARVTFHDRPIGYVEHQGKRVPISRLVIDEIVDLPDPEKNTWFIVSGIVQKAAPDRKDLLIPYKTIRRGGCVIGCKALLQI